MPAFGLFDLLSEVMTSISRNKLRVALTGFSVAFGILMLIILLAAGNGLLNGVMHNFEENSHNVLEIYPGHTSREWHGMPKGRSISINIKDTVTLRTLHGRHIERFIPVIEHSVTIASGTNSRNGSLCGYAPSYLATANFTITHGRWINDADMSLRRKVAVVNTATAEAIFPQNPVQDCIGKWVRMDSILYQVVGLYNSRSRFGDDHEVYIPYSTLATLYNGSENTLGSLRLVLCNLNTAEAISEFEDQIRSTFARLKEFDPDDHGVWIWDTAEEYLETKKMFDGINLLIWIIGVASLMAGIVGVSNIMLITVRERTREFGIRKAIGARPRSIVQLVILESVAITLIFGYIGMFIGIWITHFAADAITKAAQGGEHTFSVFRDPHVDLGVVAAATLTMVVAGLIAGYMPAMRAVKIKTVEALAS